MSAAPAGAEQRTAAPPGETERRFFVGMGVAAALTVFAGFAPSYFLRGKFGLKPLVIPGFESELTPLLHLHGLIFTAWIVLFVTQAVLVARRRTDLHRRMGVVGAILAVAMIVVGFNVALWSARRGFSPPGAPPALVFFVIPVFDLVVFSSLAGTALFLRRQPQTHKRLMLLATIGLLTPAIARVPGLIQFGPLAFFGLTDLFVVACIIYDRRTRGRVHPAFRWGGLAFVVSQPLRLAVASTGAWLAFATWVTS